VAFRWRIRHKLILGLGLVVGIMALLLGGTLLGLLSYMATMKTMDSKLQELKKATEFKEAMNTLAQACRDHDTADDAERLHAASLAAQEKLAEYKSQLQWTLDKHRDPNDGREEVNAVDNLEIYFGQLDKAITSPEATMTPLREGVRLGEQKDVRVAVAQLLQFTDDLHRAIYGDLFTRRDVAKRHYQISLTVVVATSIVGVLLMAGLLRSFYCWVFYPVRDLESGSRRLGQGDFEHRIEVHSGDEMEDLAAAFNTMADRLRDIYRDLARQVTERSRQLVRSERLASVGFLAAGVAHEINNPLQAITLYSGALEARLADWHRAQGEVSPRSQAELEIITRYLKTILEEAFRCKRITERLLEVSRGGEGQRERADLAELVHSVIQVAQAQPSARGKTIAFRVEPAGGKNSHVVAWVNADEIKSVVLNLVVNALESMDEGGVLTIRLGEQDGQADLEFSDTGCGMPAEVLENIFEPFFTRNRSGKGTGLGLTISHRIITQHGGEIEAHSAGVNQGSTFRVRLPLGAAPENKETKGEGRDRGATARSRQAA
jgi:two-component system, NtrC family, sensor kinase